MKKLISIISIILAVCLIVSCGNVNETVTSGTNATINASTTETTADTTVSTTDVTTAVENTSTAPAQTVQTTVAATTKATTAKTEATTGSVAGGCEISVTIEDYDEYISFITSMGMPDSFITYDELSFLGNFKMFICPPFASAKELTQYIYDFKDSNGYDIAIDIRPIKNTVSTDNILMLDDVKDYRYLSSDERGIFTTNGLTYRYLKGELSCIEFKYNDMQFVISGNGMLSDYPVNGVNTFMSKLLSADTAKDAAAQLSDLIAEAKK